MSSCNKCKFKKNAICILQNLLQALNVSFGATHHPHVTDMMPLYFPLITSICKFMNYLCEISLHYCQEKSHRKTYFLVVDYFTLKLFV